MPRPDALRIWRLSALALAVLITAGALAACGGDGGAEQAPLPEGALFLVVDAEDELVLDVADDRVREGPFHRVGVADRVSFRIEDLFLTDLGDATVVAFYLFPTVNRKLQPKLVQELKPGTRVVSHEYLIGDWPPDHTEIMVIEGQRHELHLWTVR